MISSTTIVVLGLAQVCPVVWLAKTGNLKSSARNLCPLRQGVINLGPLSVSGPVRNMKPSISYQKSTAIAMVGDDPGLTYIKKTELDQALSPGGPTWVVLLRTCSSEVLVRYVWWEPFESRATGTTQFHNLSVKWHNQCCQRLLIV